MSILSEINIIQGGRPPLDPPPPKGSLAKNSDDIDDHKGTHLSIWDECVM